jgi:Ca-activated chloride channel family protein
MLMVFIASFPAYGQQPEQAPADKTLSPYFFVQGGDPEVDTLPLRSTRADVDIAGVIARVHVTQVYKNTGKRPIEAIYVFPGSTRAAVFGMKMTIGERVIVAKIEERRKARADYEAAKAAGQSASLLEQQRPNVFQMNVANIMPGDVINVELDYTELLVPENGTYEFVYPTVVGPRYSETPSAGAPDTETWVANPYLHEGDPEPFTFDIDVTLNSGIPIARMSCDSHKTDIEYEGKTTASVSLADTKGAGTKDFILRYSLEGNKVQSGILLYPGEDENFFLVMMEPPARVGKGDIPPREYIFVLDVSGSMNGFPLNTAKKLMRDLITQLKPTDTFNVVLFAGRAAVMSEKSLPATKENIEKAMNTIDSQSGGGGTRLLNALTTAFALPRQSEDVARSTVIVTDGYVSCETQAFDLIRQNLNKSNVFTFGIGSSVNRHLIEGMARSGFGEPLIVTGPNEAGPKADKFREYIRQPVLTQIEVDFKGLNAYDIEPISVPDVLAERPVIVFGKYKGTPRGSVKISGFSGEGEYMVKLDIGEDMEDKTNTALRYLWARHRIKTLADYNNLSQDAERVAEVTNLGLTYNLLTAYTSFVAIDSEVRNQGGDQATVKQLLPLPDGVSDLAVGGSYALSSSREVKALGYLASPQAKHKRMAKAPTPRKEQDGFSIGQALSGLAGGRSNSAPAPVPAEPERQVAAKPKTHSVIHGAKNGKLTSTEEVLYAPKGKFKVDREAGEITVGDELRALDANNEIDDKRLAANILSADKPVTRIDGPDVQPNMPEMRIDHPEDESDVFSLLLLAGIPAIVAGLLIWRFRTGKKHRLPETDDES